MTTTLYEKTYHGDFERITWKCLKDNAVISNPVGFKNAHTSRITSGRAQLTYGDEDPIEKTVADEDFEIPINTPYVIVALEKGVMECDYDIENGAADEIAHIPLNVVLKWE